jgi:hypothetical protein
LQTASISSEATWNEFNISFPWARRDEARVVLLFFVLRTAPTFFLPFKHKGTNE